MLLYLLYLSRRCVTCCRRAKPTISRATFSIYADKFTPFAWLGKYRTMLAHSRWKKKHLPKIKKDERKKNQFTCNTARIIAFNVGFSFWSFFRTALLLLATLKIFSLPMHSQLRYRCLLRHCTVFGFFMQHFCCSSFSCHQLTTLLSLLLSFRYLTFVRLLMRCIVIIVLLVWTFCKLLIQQCVKSSELDNFPSPRTRTSYACVSM